MLLVLLACWAVPAFIRAGCEERGKRSTEKLVWRTIDPEAERRLYARAKQSAPANDAAASEIEEAAEVRAGRSAREGRSCDVDESAGKDDSEGLSKRDRVDSAESGTVGVLHTAGGVKEMV